MKLRKLGGLLAAGVVLWSGFAVAEASTMDMSMNPNAVMKTGMAGYTGSLPMSTSAAGQFVEELATSDVNLSSWGNTGTWTVTVGGSFSVGDVVTLIPYTSGNNSDAANYQFTVTSGETSGFTVSFPLAFGSGNLDFDKMYVYDATSPFTVNSMAVSLSGVSQAAVPTGVSAVAGVQSVSLSWSASSGAHSYNVYEGAASSPVATGITGTSYTAGGLTAGQSYTFEVSAVDVNGNESAKSSSVSAVPLAPPPASPTGLTATGSGDGKSVALSWSAVSGADSYNVYVDGSGTPAQTGLTGTTSTVSGFSPGSTHTFAVSAVGAGGESALSASQSVTLAGVPPAPTGVVAKSSADGKSATVTWNAVPGATGYVFYLDGSVANVDVGSGTSYTYSPLVPGSQHQYQVAAENSVATGALSATVTMTQADVPPAPTGLVGSGGDTTASLTWSPVAGATSYNVYRDGVEVAHGGTTTSYSDSALTNGTAYSYQVSAVNAVGEGALSTAVSVTPQKGVTPVAGLVLLAGKTEVDTQWTGSAAPFTVTWSVYGNQAGTATTSADSYLITGLTANTDYAVTVTDAKGNSVNGTVNSGNQSLIVKPSMPDPTPVYQNMLDGIGTAGRYVLAIIGGAVGLGVLLLVGLYAYRVFRKWLRGSK